MHFVPDRGFYVTACASCVAGFLAALVAIASAQTPSVTAAAQVAIDFRAITADGKPVTDLELNDLTLRIDGRAREIGSLEVVRAEPGGGGAPVFPPPFATNDEPGGARDTLIVIEDESFPAGTEPVVRRTVERYLAGLSPGDRVGYMTLPRPTVNIRLTSQVNQVREAIGTMVGRARRDESTEDAVCRTRVDLEALKNVFVNLAGERLTTVVFFASGLMPPNSGAALPGTQPLCELRAENYQDVAAAAGGSSISFYVVHVVEDAAPGAANTTDLLTGLESLAGVTEGQLLRLSNETVDPAARVLVETSARYRLTFEPEAGDQDGESHRIELRVSREHVRVSSRQRVTIAKAGVPLRVKSSPSLGDMLRAEGLRRELPLLMAGSSSRNPGDDKIRVVVLFEPVERSAKLTGAMVGLFDAEGKLRAQGTVSSSNLARFPAMAALTVPAGRYRLRLAAADAAGRGGSVEEEFRAELVPAAGMKLSSMVFGTNENDNLTPRLQFADEQSAIVYLELYGAPKAGTLSAVLEIAGSVDGPTLLTGPAVIRAGSSPDSRRIMSSITIGPMPPGDLVVRMIVSLDGNPAGRAFRTLRKTAQ